MYEALSIKITQHWLSLKRENRLQLKAEKNGKTASVVNNREQNKLCFKLAETYHNHPLTLSVIHWFIEFYIPLDTEGWLVRV